MSEVERQAGRVLGDVVRLLVLMGVPREGLADVLRNIARTLTAEAAENKEE